MLLEQHAADQSRGGIAVQFRFEDLADRGPIGPGMGPNSLLGTEAVSMPNRRGRFEDKDLPRDHAGV